MASKRVTSAKMPVIVTIGYQEILLPDMTGVETLIRTLSRGVTCNDRTYKGVVELDGKEIRVSMKLVPRGCRIVPPGGDESDMLDDLDGLPHKNGLPNKMRLEHRP